MNISKIMDGILRWYDYKISLPTNNNEGVTKIYELYEDGDQYAEIGVGHSPTTGNDFLLISIMASPGNMGRVEFVGNDMICYYFDEYTEEFVEFSKISVDKEEDAASFINLYVSSYICGQMPVAVNLHWKINDEAAVDLQTFCADGNLCVFRRDMLSTVNALNLAIKSKIASFA